LVPVVHLVRKAITYSSGTLSDGPNYRGDLEGCVVTANDADIERQAYEIAWYEFSALGELTPDEKISGPNKLRWFIHVLAEVGERDPLKIAKAAMGMLRESEQILRSKARTTSVLVRSA
jgi:hypothetical protein